MQQENVPEKKSQATDKKLRGLLGPIKDRSAAFDVLGTAGVMGLHMVSGPIAGGGLGWLVDKALGTWPWCAGLGLLLGIAAGFYNVWQDTIRILRQQDKMGGGAASKKNVNQSAPEGPLPPKADRVQYSEDLPEPRPDRKNPSRPKQPEYLHDDANDHGDDDDGLK